MNFLKIVACDLMITTSILVSGIAYADTCYDPNYDRYFYCNSVSYPPVEYYAPNDALMFNFVIPFGNQNVFGRDNYRQNEAYRYHDRYKNQDRYRNHNRYKNDGRNSNIWNHNR